MREKFVKGERSWCYVYSLETKRQSTEWMGINIGTIDEKFCYFSYLPKLYIVLFLLHYGPRVDSASNRDEYKDYFLRVKATCA
jgi:hypothetical protein